MRAPVRTHTAAGCGWCLPSAERELRPGLRAARTALLILPRQSNGSLVVATIYLLRVDVTMIR